MDKQKVAAANAKLAGILRAVNDLLALDAQKVGVNRRNQYGSFEVKHYFTATSDALETMRAEIPILFGDFTAIQTLPLVEMASPSKDKKVPNRYGRFQLERLARDIAQLFEIRANSELATPNTIETPRRVFISHGRAEDWRRVQSFIEKDMGLETVELAQEASLGMTIGQKLRSVSARCDTAVVVMTGDDQDADGQRRARENVIHEIGFFQGRYGDNRVVLLHEDGVSMPSNIHGVVYSPFPKGVIEACMQVLQRELRAMYA